MVPLWPHLSSLYIMPITVRVSQFRFGEFAPVLGRFNFITNATHWLIIETILIIFEKLFMVHNRVLNCLVTRTCRMEHIILNSNFKILCFIVL